MAKTLSDNEIMRALHRCATPSCRCNNCLAKEACIDGSFILQVIKLIERREDTIESLQRNIETLKAASTFRSRYR